MNDNKLLHYGTQGMKWGHRKNALDETSKVISSLKDINNTVSKETTKKNINSNIKKMSDDELRQKVNRLNLEQNYAKLNSSTVSKGNQYVRDTLDIAGSLVTIGASSATIMLALHQLKNKS